MRPAAGLLALHRNFRGRPAVDSTAQIAYRLDEQAIGAGTFDNWGTAGTLPLTADGNVVASRLLSPGVFGPCATFDGVATPNDLHSAATAKGEGAGSMTISCWVKQSSYHFAPIFAKMYAPAGWANPYISFGFFSGVDPDGSFGLYASVGGVLNSLGGIPGTGSIAPNPVRLRNGVWQNIVGVFDSVAHTLAIYVNGVQAAICTLAGVLDWGTHGPWAINGNPAQPNDRIASSIDECNVWTRGLTGPEILSIYAAGAPGLATPGVLPVPTFDPSSLSLTPYNWDQGGVAGSSGNLFRLANPAIFGGFYWTNMGNVNAINNAVFTWKFSLWRVSDRARLGGLTFAPTAAGRQVLGMAPLVLPADDYAISITDTGNPANVIRMYFPYTGVPVIPDAEGGGFSWLNLGAKSTGAGDVYPDILGAPANRGTEPPTISPIFL